LSYVGLACFISRRLSGSQGNKKLETLTIRLPPTYGSLPSTGCRQSSKPCALPYGGDYPPCNH